MQSVNRSRTRRWMLGAAAIAVAGLVDCGGQPADQSPAYSGTPASEPSVPGTPGRWSGRTLTVAAYGGEVERALRSLIWDPFERATGCRILTYANDPAVIGTPVTVPAVDLVLADPVSTARFISMGEGRALDGERLPKGAVDAELARVGATPAYAYALVSCCTRDTFPENRPPGDWRSWWNLDQFPGDRTMRRDPLGTLEIALLADGVDIAALYPLDIARALASLARIADAVGPRWWTRAIEPVSWLSADRAALGVAWHHRVLEGQWQGMAVDLSWNQGILATDCWLLPAAAEEPDLAADLLAWTLSPEQQARFARETRLGPINPDAFTFIEPWLLDTLPTAPPQVSSLAHLDGAWWAEHGAEAQAAMSAWLDDRLPASSPG
ncbi:MAG: extracellular solute-binding protein, partial [Thermomicrobiales bacterium]